MRWNGRVYEAVSALAERRAAHALFHSALVVSLPPAMWVVEMTPAWQRDTTTGDRGVVAEGAVGARWAGRSKLFRYEVRCWRGGSIADISEAVESPIRLTEDEATCHRLLELMPSAPAHVWGRDQLGAGEMWNSNSVTSWALARTGLDPRVIRPPRRGRAPGWGAGIIAAGRQQDQHAATAR